MNTPQRQQSNKKGKLRRTQLRAFHNRPTGTVNPDAANRIHCKSRVARTRQIAAGQNRMAGSIDPETVFRFHCKLQVAMTTAASGPHPAQALPTIFARRGPRGAPNFARLGKHNNWARAVPRISHALGRRPGELFRCFFNTFLERAWCSRLT